MTSTEGEVRGVVDSYAAREGVLDNVFGELPLEGVEPEAVSVEGAGCPPQGVCVDRRVPPQCVQNLEREEFYGGDVDAPRDVVVPEPERVLGVGLGLESFDDDRGVYAY